MRKYIIHVLTHVVIIRNTDCDTFVAIPCLLRSQSPNNTNTRYGRQYKGLMYIGNGMNLSMLSIYESSPAQSIPADIGPPSMPNPKTPSQDKNVLKLLETGMFCDRSIYSKLF